MSRRRELIGWITKSKVLSGSAGKIGIRRLQINDNSDIDAQFTNDTNFPACTLIAVATTVWNNFFAPIGNPHVGGGGFAIKCDRNNGFFLFWATDNKWYVKSKVNGTWGGWGNVSIS